MQCSSDAPSKAGRAAEGGCAWGLLKVLEQQGLPWPASTTCSSCIRLTSKGRMLLAPTKEAIQAADAGGGWIC